MLTSNLDDPGRSSDYSSKVQMISNLCTSIAFDWLSGAAWFRISVYWGEIGSPGLRWTINPSPEMNQSKADKANWRFAREYARIQIHWIADAIEFNWTDSPEQIQLIDTV